MSAAQQKGVSYEPKFLTVNFVAVETHSEGEIDLMLSDRYTLYVSKELNVWYQTLSNGHLDSRTLTL